MRSKLTAALIAFATVFAAGSAGAQAATTPNFTFKHGQANHQTAASTVPGAYQGGTRPPCANNAPGCTYEAHEFEIAPGDANGSFAVTITWGDENDDWDLYVYRVRDDGSVNEDNPVASSAQGGTTDETATVKSSETAPVAPGKYRIYVDNWAVATSQDWEGFVAFSPFVPGNLLPTAAFTVPASATAGAPVTLDGATSSDPDGSVVDYAWDLDGNGSFEVDNGASPTITRTFPAGRVNASLRIRDDRGAVAYASRSVTVAAAAAQASTTPATPERIGFDLPRRQKIGTVLRRGLAATVACPSACTIASELTASRATARRLGRRTAFTLARQTRRLQNRGFARVRVRPSGRALRAALRRQRSVRATVRIAVTATNGERRTLTRTVTIVR